MEKLPRTGLITFDCYGTLIDWYGGLGATLSRLAGPDTEPRPLCERYVEIEKEVEAGPYLSYREVMARTLAALAGEVGWTLGEGDRDALGRLRTVGLRFHSSLSARRLVGFRRHRRLSPLYRLAVDDRL